MEISEHFKIWSKETFYLALYTKFDEYTAHRERK